MTRKIYTIGRMKGLSYAEQIVWRNKLEIEVRDRSNATILFYHPPDYYGYNNSSHKTEAEVKEWELNHVLDCDIAVVNLSGINESVGSHFELGIINAINMFGNKHIYVIGIGDLKDIHPWIQLSIFRQEDDIESAADYITSYLI